MSKLPQVRLTFKRKAEIPTDENIIVDVSTVIVLVHVHSQHYIINSMMKDGWVLDYSMGAELL